MNVDYLELLTVVLLGGVFTHILQKKITSNTMRYIFCAVLISLYFLPFSNESSFVSSLLFSCFIIGVINFPKWSGVIIDKLKN